MRVTWRLSATILSCLTLVAPSVSFVDVGLLEPALYRMFGDPEVGSKLRLSQSRVPGVMDNILLELGRVALRHLDILPVSRQPTIDVNQMDLPPLSMRRCTHSGGVVQGASVQTS